jgi:predicted nucleic-acid-binding Zn-ribbon protein
MTLTTKLLCPHCESDNIVRDACAHWDGTRWVMLDVYDNMICNDCGAEFYEAKEVDNVDH